MSIVSKEVFVSMREKEIDFWNRYDDMNDEVSLRIFRRSDLNLQDVE